MKAQIGSMVSYKRPDGKELQGYLAAPAPSPSSPAVVVVQEWWGLNAQIRGVADRLARCGYRALVPDLYRGKSTAEEEEAHHLMDSLDFGDAASQDIAGAVAFLKQQGGRVAVMGFCMGGALVLLALAHNPDIAAGVTWYGLPPLEYLDVSRIRAPILGHWASQDVFFPSKNVDALEKKLAEAGVHTEFHRYLAHHAFANETAIGPARIAGTQFDPVWAQLAWDRSLTFLARRLFS